MRVARLASLQLAFAVAASFLGSLLLFAFEPYIGKILLPSFGGTPLLWNTCMVFFQVALFLGYAYALALTRTFGARRQLMIQLVVLGALFAVYPGAHIAPGLIHAAESPGLVLAERLTRHVLLPFVALAAVTTLVQSWLARSPAQAGRSPYRLYAASNAGSLAGLFAYPLLLEPYLSLAEQRTAMLLMLGAVILALAGLGGALRSDDTPAPSPPLERATSAAPEPARVPRSVWLTVIGLTALPASLLLGVTNYVLTDIASVPLFWVVPLALYLTTFIIAFARRGGSPRWPLGRVFALLAAVAVVSLAAETTAPAPLLIPLHLTAVFLGSLLCHLKVASLAPHPRWLPHYYLTIALGGALGGIVTLLVPPLVTDGFLEYPAALVLCTLVLGATDPVGRSWRGRAVDFMLPAVLVVAGTVALHRVLPANLEPLAAAAYLPAAVFAYSANARGRVFTARLASLLLASLFLPSPFGRTIFAERNFYGRVRVTRDLVGDFHKVVHGSTVHGMQRVSDMHRCSPASYYHPSGPAGRFLTALTPAATPRRVALIGLGSGALVCYARSGEVWDLYELNPAMARVAADGRLFTFLQGSAAEAKNVVLGDARLSLERNATARYDLLIVDAFSSDAIPIHLITKEAIASYARRLRPGGVLLFHVSNRFFRLTPVLAAAAPQVRMAAFVFKDLLIAPADRESGKYASEWVILAPEDHGQTLSGEWVRVPPSDMRVWTDDYSNPLRAMVR